MTTTYILSIEGQEIPLPPELGQDDEKLRRALTSIIPGAGQAQISRAVKEGVTTITVVKRAGSKGCASALSSLIQCFGGTNPVISLYTRLKEQDLSALPAEELLILDRTIQTALEAGEAQRITIKNSQKRLLAARAQPASGLVIGF